MSQLCKISANLRSTIVQSFRTYSSKKSWKITRLNHIAVAVPNLEKSCNTFSEVLGLDTTNPQTLPDHGVKVVFASVQNTKIELLEKYGKKSPIEKFLEKNKAGGIHHICVEVDDIYAAVEDLKKNNVRLLSPKPSIGSHGLPVIFLHPKDMNGILVELEQQQK